MKTSTRNRIIFSMVYGNDTTRVVQMTLKGWDNQKIASHTNLSRGTIAAIRANYTRGNYFPYAYVSSQGRRCGVCKY